MKKLGTLGIIVTFICVIFIGFSAAKIGTNLDDSDILVTQDAYDGDITVYNTGGWKWTLYAGRVGYSKRGQLEFAPSVDDAGVSSINLDSADAKPYGLRLRFNDKGGATFYGQFSYIMPEDKELIKKIRSKYPTEASMERDLIRPVITKAVYMTGPTMSSEESTATKRPELIESIMDQINFGPYKTVIKPEEILDTLSGEMKNVMVAKIVEDLNAPNGKARQEISPLIEFGIVVINPEIKKIKYDGNVEKQIETQRKITMDIQTAIAKAREAEQNAIKAVEEGKANAATAEWKQKTINAKDIALAEKNKAVAQLDKEAAVFTKAKDILIGQGKAEKKRLIMNADGALAKKGQILIEIAKINADAIKNYKGNWVPQIVSGGAGTGNGASQGGQMMLEAMGIKALKDLSLDLSTK